MAEADAAHDLSNKSVVKAMALLTELGPHRHGITVTELAHNVRMSRPTVFRLLLSLAQGGFVEKIDSKYRLGWKMARLGRLADPHGGIIALVQPLIETLAEQLNEMIGYAVVQDETGFELIAEASASRFLTLSQGWVGKDFPLHASAVGKVVLAELADERLRELLPGKLPRFTARTIVDRDALLASLAAVRRQRYATIEDELEESLFAVAVPVRSGGDRLIGVLALTAPTPRITARDLGAIVAGLRQTAGRISAASSETCPLGMD